jgi:hypothetical protein
VFLFFCSFYSSSYFIPRMSAKVVIPIIKLVSGLMLYSFRFPTSTSTPIPQTLTCM